MSAHHRRATHRSTSPRGPQPIPRKRPVHGNLERHLHHHRRQRLVQVGGSELPLVAGLELWVLPRLRDWWLWLRLDMSIMAVSKRPEGLLALFLPGCCQGLGDVSTRRGSRAYETGYETPEERLGGWYGGAYLSHTVN